MDEMKRQLNALLCDHCRNRINEAHLKCAIEGQYHKFWPDEYVTVKEVAEPDVRRLLSGAIGSGERQALAWLYLLVLFREARRGKECTTYHA